MQTLFSIFPYNTFIGMLRFFPQLLKCYYQSNINLRTPERVLHSLRHDIMAQLSRSKRPCLRPIDSRKSKPLGGDHLIVIALVIRGALTICCYYLL